MGSLILAYQDAGFDEQAAHYSLEAFKLSRDSADYYRALYNKGQLEGLEFQKKAYAYDTTDNDRLWWLGIAYYYSGQYEESFACISNWMQKEDIYWIHILRASSHRIGHIYWLNGYQEEAEEFFDQQIEYCNRAIELGRTYATVTNYAYYDFAAVYAFL